MAIVNQGSNPRLNQDGVNAIAGAMYGRYAPEWRDYLDEFRSDKAYEIDVYQTPMRTAQRKTEGAEAFQDTFEQLYRAEYVNATYAIRTEITMEALSDNRYQDPEKTAARYLEESLQEAEQIEAADVINSGYTTFLGGDGVSVFNTAHPLGKGGGTFSNRFSAYTALSEAALEDACTAVAKFTDAAGKIVRHQTTTLVVPEDLWGTACRLLDSKFQAESGNNAINAINAKGKFSKGVSTQKYFTDTGAWFVKTDCENGGKFFRRMDHTFKSDNSNNSTWGYSNSGVTRFSVGVTDPRFAYGSGPSA